MDFGEMSVNGQATKSVVVDNRAVAKHDKPACRQAGIWRRRVALGIVGLPGSVPFYD